MSSELLLAFVLVGYLRSIILAMPNVTRGFVCFLMFFIRVK